MLTRVKMCANIDFSSQNDDIIIKHFPPYRKILLYYFNTVTCGRVSGGP